LGDAGYVKALLGDEKHWVRALPGKLLHNLISHGLAKVAEFLTPPARVVAVHGMTSPTLRAAGENDIVDELRVIVCDASDTTAYFTFTTQIKPPVQELRLFGRRGGLMIDNVHRTVIEVHRSNSEFKSYANFFLPPLRSAQQHMRNLWRNGMAFLRADFHMDAGMKNLIEAFYRSIQTGGEPPISHREILITASLMDDVFKQLDLARGSANDDSSRRLASSGARL
jgi:predicted dehydrogenase